MDANGKASVAVSIQDARTRLMEALDTTRAARKMQAVDARIAYVAIVVWRESCNDQKFDAVPLQMSSEVFRQLIEPRVGDG